MSRETTTVHICDRCKREFELNGYVIERLTYQLSGYDPRGDGGAKIGPHDFCQTCTSSFKGWMKEGARDD